MRRLDKPIRVALARFGRDVQFEMREMTPAQRVIYTQELRDAAARVHRSVSITRGTYIATGLAVHRVGDVPRPMWIVFSCGALYATILSRVVRVVRGPATCSGCLSHSLLSEVVS